MTYGELLHRLFKLNTNQLNTKITVYDRVEREYKDVKIYDTVDDLLNDTHSVELENGHPYIVI